MPESTLSESLTYNQLVKGITEFSAHSQTAEVYPAEIFIRRKKYDTPVYQSRHPGLNQYISGAVEAMREEILLGTVDKVVVVIKDTRDDVALERFIFSIQNMIVIEPYNKDTSVDGAMSPLALGQYFRSFLIKLTMIESQLGHLYLGEDISFAIVLELLDGKAPAASQTKADPSPWMPAAGAHTTMAVSDHAELFMVRAVDTGIINLSLAVQESEEKLRRVREESGEDVKGKGKAI